MRIWIVTVKRNKETLSEVNTVDIQSALEYIRVASPLMDNDTRISLRTAKFNEDKPQKYPI